MPAPGPQLFLGVIALFAVALDGAQAQEPTFDQLRERFREVVHRSPDSALVIAEAGVRMARRTGDQEQHYRSAAMMGQVWHMKGHPDKALTYYQQALGAMDAHADPFARSMMHGSIAEIHLSQGHWAPAAQHARTAMAGFQALGQTIWSGASMRDLAVALLALGRDDSARVLLDHAAMAMGHDLVKGHDSLFIALRDGLDADALDRTDTVQGPRSIVLPTKLAMARSMDALGLQHRAVNILQEVLADARVGGFDKERMEAHRLLASIHEETSDPAPALEHFKAYVALKDSLDSHHTARAIAELQERFEGARKDAALKDQRAINARQRVWLIGTASGALLLTLLLTAVLLWRRRERGHVLEMGERNAQLDAALAEKELLLQEVHHRVKNNLQMVGSLLRMQGRSITDPKARMAVRDSQDRVRSMALIHQDLYGEGHTRGIDMAIYVDKLANGLLRSHGLDRDRIALQVDVPPLHLDVDTAVPIGLILNELIVNALKHAFPDGRPGTLRVSLHRQVDGLHLEVSDDGVGLTFQAINEEGGGGFGLGMLRTFADKLQADYETIGERGTTIRLLIRSFSMAG